MWRVGACNSFGQGQGGSNNPSELSQGPRRCGVLVAESGVPMSVVISSTLKKITLPLQPCLGIRVPLLFFLVHLISLLIRAVDIRCFVNSAMPMSLSRFSATIIH